MSQSPRCAFELAPRSHSHARSCRLFRSTSQAACGSHSRPNCRQFRPRKGGHRGASVMLSTTSVQLDTALTPPRAPRLSWRERLICVAAAIAVIPTSQLFSEAQPRRHRLHLHGRPFHARELGLSHRKQARRCGAISDLRRRTRGVDFGCGHGDVLVPHRRSRTRPLELAHALHPESLTAKSTRGRLGQASSAKRARAITRAARANLA